MEHDPHVTGTGAPTIRCTGDASASHPPVEVAVDEWHVARCSACGRRYRRPPPPGSVCPASWPRGE